MRTNDTQTGVLSCWCFIFSW